MYTKFYHTREAAIAAFTMVLTIVTTTSFAADYAEEGAV
jgi:hypothetical protein